MCIYISLFRWIKGTSLVSGVTPCSRSTLMRKRTAMTLLMQEGEEPQWMISLEAQNWADRYFTDNISSTQDSASLASRKSMVV